MFPLIKLAKKLKAGPKIAGKGIANPTAFPLIKLAKKLKENTKNMYAVAAVLAVSIN